MHYIEYIDKYEALAYLCNIAKERNLKVTDLVESVVDLGNFSRMKNEQTKTVSLDLVIYLAKQLGENVEDVLRETSPTNPDFFEAVDSIRYYSQIHDYEACKYLINKTKKTFEKEIESSIEVYQNILWHEAIVNIELNKDYTSTLDTLKFALKLNNKHFSLSEFNPQSFSELEIGIINSILICYFNLNKSNEDIKYAYENIINFLESKHINDYEIAFNIYYEYLLISGQIDYQPNELLEIALNAAQLALDNGITNKLPFIYTQIAYIYTDLGDKENMEEYYSTAIFLYKQIGVPEAYLNKIIANREECRKIVENPEAYQ